MDLRRRGGRGAACADRPMPDQPRVLRTLGELDLVFSGSAARPVLLFKHSLTCPTSTRAYTELEKLLAGPPLDVDVVVVHVQTGRDVSNEVAQRCGVRHESPQALLLHDGHVVWHASHHHVTREAMAEAVGRHLPVPLGPVA